MVEIQDLFEFPILMIDGEKEDNYQNLGLSNDNPEVITGAMKAPHWDFLFIRDRWSFSEDSYNDALQNGNFDSCIVEFERSGSYIVPWKKEEFLKKLDDFRKKLPKKESKIHFFEIDPLKLLKDENTPSQGDTGHT